MLRIDTHTHILPREMPKWSERFGGGQFIHLEHGSRKGFARMMQGNHFFREIGENCWDENVRKKEYAAHSTQVQVVCTIPVMFNYDAPVAYAEEIAQFLNDHIANLVANDPMHYAGLATVPMQDTDRAIRELERAQAQGHLGVQIGSNINGMNLSDDRFFPFFEACDKLSMAVMVHPWDMMGKEQMEKYWLPWLVGMPAETARAASSMIFGGVLERLPGLRVMFSHAGGSFLPTLGRFEHGYRCRPDLVAVDNEVNPREYLGKFWIDSITHDADLLNYVLKMQGAERICMGSDYPFPLGDLELGAYMLEMGLSQDQLNQLFSGAALAWLGVPPDYFNAPS
ncbi:MAG TPA: 2-amino-3-carboxymuconate-6-semialdehyde decarboxylase [Flavobacteriales bacterium]|nr:2-amino-3-carboxymuconate-6-semialdehyde decarboxylase [Flavobacteriales bacterium]